MLRSKPVRAISASAKSRLTFPFQLLPLLLAALLLWAPGILTGQSSASLAPGPKPADIPQAWKPWIGEYRANISSPPPDIVVSERDGQIEFLRRTISSDDAHYVRAEKFPASETAPVNMGLRTNKTGQREIEFGDVIDIKITPEFDDRAQVLITPLHPVSALRADALASSPPHEDGTFRKPELVELTTLDPAIHLDIRYATTNDFLGTSVYTQARAFLQRPAAQALVRALHKLQLLGYGLLIHDAYRPWYVTKIFWDATPPEGKIFVADPSQGSRHNRGCAVDLTLYDLATGKPIEMPGTYDEMSPRSFPDYPGGTSLQRWHRDLLRRAMESEGFTVYEHEWWHFDYKDWHEYPILNIKFEDLHSGQGLANAQ
ncbi:MAG TPA: M15 family metallopeptidase [Candidatus Acidoferrum sp.]|nr:M15 family metallopeptidase [Candidatus Acidoferrum sp.]